MTTAFPLSWPDTFPRTKKREKGQFKTTLANAIKNVQGSLRLFSRDSGKPLRNLVISSNVTLGGLQGDDPGVAVWFTWDEAQVCIPVDRYTTVSSNLQAIHYIIEARRVELRHGTLALVRATFQGFKALPAPNWRKVLEFGAQQHPLTIKDVEERYRSLAKEWHPDRGGQDEYMALLNVARDLARVELGG
jgi:hypothetical protein